MSKSFLVLFFKKELLPSLLFLAGLPIVVHLPALSGFFAFDPIYVASGLAPDAWTTNGWLPGQPGWIDANAGVTTEALGALAAHDWLTGIVPWWNPYAGAGLPLAAEGQTPAFFLPFVLLLGRPHGLLLLRMLLMVVAGVSTLALLRRLGLGTLAALLGATLFELNGTFAWLAHGPAMPVAFLPMMLFGVEQARGRSWPWALILGVMWTLLAGFPEVAALDLLFVAVWAFARMPAAWDGWAFVARVGGASLLGGLIAAPAVWPFLQALPSSFVGAHAGIVTSGLRRDSLALLLFPGVLGAPLALPAGASAVGSVWWLAGGYCDFALVALALAGFFGAWHVGGGLRRLNVCLAAWLVITGLRAFAWPPAAFLFGMVPLVRQISVHAWILPSWSMTLCVAAACGVQHWREGRRLRLGRALLCMLPVAAGSLVLERTNIAALWGRLPHYAPVLAFSLIMPAATMGAMIFVARRPCTARRGAAFAAVAAVDAALLFAMPLLAGTHGRHIDVASIRTLQGAEGDLGRVLPMGPLVPNYGSMYGVAELAHNGEPLPENWVRHVRSFLSPNSNGVSLFEGAVASVSAARLLAYEEAGASLALTLPGADPFAGAGPERPVRFYRGAAMDIWRLPHPAAYFQAAGCVLNAKSRTALNARCETSAQLTRLELAAPGWQASVNHVAAEIRTTREIFQAVTLPAGDSSVVFSFTPPFIGWAWAASFVGVVVAVAGRRKVFFFEKKKQKTFANK
jgi:hypothetical protein